MDTFNAIWPGAAPFIVAIAACYLVEYVIDIFREEDKE